MEDIPGPKAWPFLGNIPDMWQDRDMPLRALERLADMYGPIYQVTLGGKRRIVCSSASLMQEVTDEKRWAKAPPQSLEGGTRPKGLFAARNEDPDWGQAHRILMPVFAPLAVQDMFLPMKDIANQLVLSWARKGPENRILVTDDLTRLTLDTIALCTMDYRFNSFYTDAMHPFIKAMNFIFEENTAKASRPAFAQPLMWRKNAEYKRSAELLREVGQKIIDSRRANPIEKNDVLNVMIHGKDPKTGVVMRDELITEQMITFLIAGHETTSGLLSFALMSLLKSPGAYLKAQKEVDAVVGTRSIELADISKLKYLNAVLRETIRLNPTVPVLQKDVPPELKHQPLPLDGGRYKVDAGDQLILLLGKAQRDPKVWGENGDQFEPDRMLDENFEKLSAGHPAAWKPFGNGKRACIGRAFAWQESLLVLAVILQHFDVKLDDPNYKPVVKQALTVKPDHLYVRVNLRKGLDATTLDAHIHSKGTVNGTQSVNGAEPVKGIADGTNADPMLILYGSNTGTCQSFAQRLASEATGHGFKAEVRDMDSATSALPKDIPVVIITASYEGEPPDNAARFVNWLEDAAGTPLTGVKYSVFGVGHKDWQSTFQRIPRLTDECMQKLGATQLTPFSSTDASKGTMYSDFEEWLDATFWQVVAPSKKGEPTVDDTQCELSTNARASSLRHDVSLATVVETRQLTAEGEPVKNHIELELPSDVTYECGDYLAVLPLNSEKKVREVLGHFGLPWDAVMTLKSEIPSSVPLNTPLSCFDVLKSYVELSQPATKKNLRTLADHTSSAATKTHLLSLAADPTTLTTTRTSVFDILQHHPTIQLPFPTYLSMLPPLRVRQYSISSSPLQNASHCTLTYGVISRASLADPTQVFEGVTGTYLSSLQVGDKLQVAVRSTANKNFRLPADPETTPLLMFAAGTGFAPFHGFLQERAVMLRSNPGRKLAPALLFVGCRSQTTDRLYAEELDEWEKLGVVSVKYAFSKDPEASLGCRYVGERLTKEAAEVVALWRSGARGYICGTRQFATGVAAAAKEVAKEARKARQAMGLEVVDEAEMQTKWEEMIEGRVANDVFD